MRTLMITTALAVAATAAPAFAQEAAPFEGPRVEGIVGWDRVDQKGSKSDGFAYGVAAGYDFRQGNFVFGPEVELSSATTDNTDNGVLVAGDTLKLDAGRDLYAGARIGTVLGDSTLLYAKGGYTNARVKYDYTAGAVNVKGGQNLDGWRVGAGLEHSLGNNTYVKAEYRYSNANRLDAYKVDLDRHQVVAGFGIRF